VKSDLATTASEVEIDVDPNRRSSTGRRRVGVQGEVQNALTGTKAGTVSLAGVPADVYLQLNAQLELAAGSPAAACGRGGYAARSDRHGL